ncbi:uncharacterized protein N7496_000569 [Penicillium cataractarum]|uniref:Uncharacterized protein n=1 Tax=Penicillium cataractarum TaxID=2100454 RepID=A0A9W9VUA7_9EURO|nr:uncharacterized protein N7496_000569 [Penicillium cataractarum]KAJ5389501.1 hypothetical protein N7496_000569 [Penicillium cataractarum]
MSSFTILYPYTSSLPFNINPDPVLYYGNPLIMPVLVNNNEHEGEQSMPRAPSTQSYAPGCFTNLRNESNQPVDQQSPLPTHSMQRLLPRRRPSEYRPSLKLPPVDTTFTTSSADKPLPSIEAISGMTPMPSMPATTSMAPQWCMGPAPSMVAMPIMAPMNGLPPLRRWKAPNPITTAPPPAPFSARPNTRKRIMISTGRPTTSRGLTTASVVDGHHPKSEGAYYPPTKRIKREPTDAPSKPSWAVPSETDNASIISLPPLPASLVAPSRNSNPPPCRTPPAPIIPAPLEPFPEAGTIMNFPLPQIDHQGQRPAATAGYYSSLEDDALYQTQEPSEIEEAYRAALRVRERVDWDCRRLGLRLRYLRRCRARMSERSWQMRESEWERDDFVEQAYGR